jgi:hypothetical protein
MRTANRKHGEDGGGGGHGGFEVRVIGGGRAVPAAAGEGGLEIGLRIGAEALAERLPEGEAPVPRLEAVERDEQPVAARPMSEVGPAEPRVPRGRRRNRRGLGHWTLWMAAGSCAVVVAAVTGLLAAGKAKAARTSKTEPEAGAPALAVGKSPPLDPRQQYFIEHSGELIAEAQALLARYAAAATVTEALPLVRDAGRVKARMEQLWQPWGAGDPFAPGEEPVSYLSGESGRPAICLAGRKGDFSRFEMVFVRDGEQLKLDWEASLGIGEVQVAELRGGAPAAGRDLRVVVRPADFHPAEFPEDRYRSYRLSDATGDHFVWGFAPVGSAVAAALEVEFNEGAVLLKKSSETRATVRLVEASGAGANCFELTEMLHKGWVTP